MEPTLTKKRDFKMFRNITISAAILVAFSLFLLFSSTPEAQAARPDSNALQPSQLYARGEMSYEEALAELSKQVQDQQLQPAALFQRSQLYRTGKRYAEATQDAQTLKSLYPDRPEGYIAMGWIEAVQGRGRAARKELDMASALADSDSLEYLNFLKSTFYSAASALDCTILHREFSSEIFKADAKYRPVSRLYLRGPVEEVVKTERGPVLYIDSGEGSHVACVLDTESLGEVDLLHTADQVVFYGSLAQGGQNLVVLRNCRLFQ